MREIVVRSWCDACFAEGQLQQEATHTYTMGVVAGETRPSLKVLELCDVHNKIAVDIQQLLSGLGQIPELPAVGKKAPVARPVEVTERPTTKCPVCQIEIVKSSLVTHIWQVHRRTETRPPMATTCPECRTQYDSGQGMAAHRRIAHGWDSLEEALSGVKGFKR